MAFCIDKSTLEEASRGDAVALGSLALALQPHIEKQLLRYPLSDEDRRDLAQSTLMQIVRRVGSFRGDSSFSTWLFRVTANEALMMMRSQRRHRARLVEGLDQAELESLPVANDADGSVRADGAAADGERDALVRQAVEELPSDYRGAFRKSRDACPPPRAPFARAFTERVRAFARSWSGLRRAKSSLPPDRSGAQSWVGPMRWIAYPTKKGPILAMNSLVCRVFLIA
jgi:RNA polymerase sigma factor (sigma-70 family)